MVGEADAKDLPGLDQLLEENGLTVPDTINRAVLIGTSRGPQDVLTVKGGTKVRTTWGDMAWQLGGKEAYALVAKNDKKGIAPGSEILEKLFKSCAPCLILIDEWVPSLVLSPKGGRSGPRGICRKPKGRSPCALATVCCPSAPRNRHSEIRIAKIPVRPENLFASGIEVTAPA